MNIEDAYNNWAAQYDQDENKTRDLDHEVTRKLLGNIDFKNVIELGCGTGKNTRWLVEHARQVIALDFSEAMLKKAADKVPGQNVQFRKMDLTEPWDIPDSSADLVTCSLVLEHIENMEFIFAQAYRKLKMGGQFFISELHPYKQYDGTRARFTSEDGQVKIQAHIHHISDYLNCARENGFMRVELREWFDGDEQEQPPRLVSFMIRKER